MAKRKKILLFFGVLIGLVNGLFGGGGGLIAVSLLTNKLGYAQKQAHATSLAIILPISLVSALVYLFNGFFPLKTGSIVTLGVLAGGVLGAILLGKLKQNLVKAIFLAITLFAGIKLLM